jgi:hypothetical protein
MINLTQHTTTQIEEFLSRGKKLNISSICEEAIIAAMNKIEPIKTDEDKENEKRLERSVSEIIDAAALHILMGNPQDKFVSRKLHDEAFVFAAKRILELNLPDDKRLNSDDLRHRIEWEYTRLKPERCKTNNNTTQKMEGETNEAEKK